MANLRRRGLVAVAGCSRRPGCPCLHHRHRPAGPCPGQTRADGTDRGPQEAVGLDGPSSMATSYDEGLTTNHRTALQASVASTLGQLAANEKALSDNTADALFQGVNIGTLENCLGGVQSSFQQIAQHDNVLAAEDISAVSGPLVYRWTGGPETPRLSLRLPRPRRPSCAGSPTSPMPPTRWPGISRSSSPPT